MQRACELLWRSEKYKVMYYSQKHYNLIRQLMRTTPTLDQLQQLLKEAYNEQPTDGSKQNAIEHMWGYFKKIATLEEKDTYKKLLQSKQFSTLQSFLYELAIQYDVTYLLNSSILHEKTVRE